MHLKFSFLGLIAAGLISAQARPWTDDVMYFAMTDRFYDGDPTNNVPEGSDPSIYDAAQKNLATYMGGDLRGLEKAIDAGYFNDMGITALWITPVTKNVWRSGYDAGGWKSGYHGYWTQDWLDIDPHLVSKTALSGEAYPEGIDGRMAHYRDFVKLAHSKGLKVIQDVILNHAGPVFYYDSNGNGKFDFNDQNEWVQPFKADGFYDKTGWVDIAKWNAKRPEPSGPRTLLGVEVPTTGILGNVEIFGRKGFSPDSLGKDTGEEVTCDFFSLRDIYTGADGKYFDAIVDEFATIYAFYMKELGVDGLRVDTVKHVHEEFWDAFSARLRAKLGDAAAEKILFGEVYDGKPEVLGRYTWNKDWPENKKPALDSVLDFTFCFSAREYLRHPGSEYGSAHALEKSMANRTGFDDSKGRPYFNPNPGADGLNSQQKMITFIENHDGINRFRVDGITERRNRLAQALVMAMPGIPCLYYGTEMALHDKDGKVDQDAETGRMMLFRHRNGPSMAEVKKTAAFHEINVMSDLRERYPVLRTGSFIPLWVDNDAGHEDDGVFAFARASEDGKDYVVVVMNASDQPRKTGSGGGAIHLPETLTTKARSLKPVAIIGGGKLQDRTKSYDAAAPLLLDIPASSMVIFEATTNLPASASTVPAR